MSLPTGLALHHFPSPAAHYSPPPCHPPPLPQEVKPSRDVARASLDRDFAKHEVGAFAVVLKMGCGWLWYFACGR